MGGAEVVCVRALEALQSNFDVTLFSLDSPDFDALNRFCGTSISPVSVRRPTGLGPAFNALVENCNRATNGRCGAHIKLKAAMLSRLVRRRTGGFDVRISTSDEMALPAPSIQYIHFPRFNNRLHDGPTGAEGPASGAYDWFCTRVAGITTDRLRDASLLANSAWTADVFEDQYGIRPAVLHPPVDTAGFEDVPWSERERGFVMSGRISPDKHVLQVVDIVSRLHERGHDVHLHIVGPTTDRNRAYRRRVERKAENYDYVTLEGAVPRDELISLISTHRYGIHGKPYEHFGLAVAEFIVGGAIPFVPDSGGQASLVDERDELLYSTPEMGVDKIERVLEDPTLQSALRNSLSKRADDFGVAEFQQALRETVESALQTNTPL